MKKLTLSLVAAGLTASSLGAYAAVPTGAAPFQVVVPNLKSGIEVTLEGMYLQPSNQNLQYSAQSAGTTANPATNVSTVNPKYNFGFRAALGYIFPNSGNDVQAAWTHFNHNTTRSVTYPFASNPSGIEVDSSTWAVQYDAWDLDVGQYLSIGTRLQTRFYIGARGVQLKSSINNTYADSQSLVPADTSASTSKFTGFGPRLGVDTSYHVGGCFGVVGHFATALLVGNVTNNASTVVGSNGNVASFTADSQRRVVPSFDAKLGLDYSIPFKNSANGSSLSIEAGYQVTQLVGAVDRFQTQNGGSPSVVTSSFGFNGPYLSLNLKV